MKIYLDNAATTMIKPFSVYGSLIKNTVFSSVNAGRGTYKQSIGAVSKLVDTAEKISELFNIEDSLRVAFFQNATYALNTAIHGYLKPEDHVIITNMAHNSVLRPVHRHGNYSVAKADECGNLDLEFLKKEIKPDTKLIICTHASNVCGSIEPIEKIIEIAHERGIKVLVDAAQTAGILDIDVSRLGIDMLAFSGHKGLLGPLGTGGLYVSDEINLEPLAVGGTGSMSESFKQPEIMPDMLHSGTQNVPAIAALGKGVDFVIKHRPEIEKYEKYLAFEFIEEILNIDSVTLYGNVYNNRNATVAFNIKNIDSIRVAQILEEEFNIWVRAGFHCAPLAHKALKTDKTGVVRASFGYFNKKSDVKKIVSAINKISKKG